MGSTVVIAEGLKSPAARRRPEALVRKQAPWIEFVTVYIVLANLPYWFVSREFGFANLGWFCVEYCLVGLIALVAPRIVSAALLLVVIFSDLLCGVCASYSLPIRESLENICAARAFSRARFLCASAAAVLTALLAFASAYLPAKVIARGQRRRIALFLAVFGIGIMGADVLSVRLGTGYLPQTLRSTATFDGVDLRVTGFPRLARIPVVRLIRMEAGYARTEAMMVRGPASAFPVPSATAIAIHATGITDIGEGYARPSIVLVVLESWGNLQNLPLKQALVQPYAEPNLLAKYDVLRGTVPFHGPTIAGEARELCGSGIGFYLQVAPASDLESCVPRQLTALGYRDIAVHGMPGKVFDRASWYSKIGFQETWFNERLKQQGLPDCAGALVGTCDADVAAWIGKRLSEVSTNPYFVHWMTLNSHLPVPVPSPLSSGAPCLSSLSLAPNTPLCSWYQLVSNVHHSVSQLAMSDLARPTVFVIVGDHAPPFADPALRAQFDYENVPYIVLIPRSIVHDKKTIVARNDAGPGRAVSVREESGRPRQTP